MSHVCLHAIGRETDRRSLGPLHAGPLPVPRNDNAAGAGRCPACNRPGAIAPTSSEYRGKGLIHHHWLCRSCGHAWITMLHVPV